VAPSLNMRARRRPANQCAPDSAWGAHASLGTCGRTPQVVAMLRVPVFVELTAVVFGALSGALHAVKRKADVVGTFSLAMSTGVGGGILRDILI